MRSTFLVLLLATAALVAGCGGKSAPPATGGTPVGTVQGRVVDPSEAPIEGADVKVLLTELSGTTDASGDFVLRNVPVGAVRVVASKDGFSTGTRTGELAADRSLHFHFVLAEVRVPTPYNRTLSLSGEVTCGLPAGASCAALGAAADPHAFEVEPNLRGMVLELDWQPPAEGLSQSFAMDVHAATAEACGDKYAGAEGGPGLRLVLLEGFPLTGGRQCVIVRPDAETTAAQQTYTLYASLFYHTPPPEGFTAIPQ